MVGPDLVFPQSRPQRQCEDCRCYGAVSRAGAIGFALFSSFFVVFFCVYSLQCWFKFFGFCILVMVKPVCKFGQQLTYSSFLLCFLKKQHFLLNFFFLLPSFFFSFSCCSNRVVGVQRHVWPGSAVSSLLPLTSLVA